MKRKRTVTCIVIAVLALAYAAWLCAYRSQKSNDNLPGLASIAAMGEEETVSYTHLDLSKDKPILEILPKGNLVFPLSQHIGAPATPIVEKGDRVLVGQKIAEAGGFVSAPVYSSVSGTVVGIEPRLVCTEMCIRDR